MALNTRIGPTAAAAALGLAALAGAGSAKAVTCTSVVGSLPEALKTHVIYGSGGSAITPTLAKVAYVLSQSATNPVFVFYQDGKGAGTGLATFKAGNGGTTGNTFKYWLTATDVTGTAPTCTADDPIAGRPVDFATVGGTVGLFGFTPDADVGTFTGPTQGINIVVPFASSETSISTEALYYVYGFSDASQLGGAETIIPWTNKDYIFKRAATAFVQQFLRGAISTLGVNFPAEFGVAKASSPDSNQGSVDNVIAAASGGHVQEAIGFTSGPTADKNRGTGKIHTLAYQHTGQDAAYWPDSTADASDKINIRNGHYFLWDTNQFLTKVTGSAAHPTLDQIVNADVKTFIGLFSGQVLSVDVTKAIIETGSIPQCAMQVTRSSDFTGLACAAPANPCGHYFDSIATGVATGDACTKDADCGPAEPKCHFNFCEAY
ncbi:MAG: hypothetical protein ABUL62_24540 [Myxococcales bacterium]